MNKKYRNLYNLIISMVFIFTSISCDTSEDRVEEWRWSGNSVDFGRVPRWSPNGEWIIFGDDRVGSSGIFIWTPGSNPQPLADPLPAHNWDYRWSPVGNKVAFTSPGEPGSGEAGVWIVDIGGATISQVFDRGRDLSWYQDGAFVAVRIDNPDTGASGIYLVNIDIGGLIFVCAGFKPVCSPTEPLISYVDSELNGKLWIIDTDANATAISDTGAYEYTWTADGSALFCAENDYPSGTFDWNIVKITRIGDSWQSEDIAQWALYPAPDRTGNQMAFLRISNATWRGLWLHTAGIGDERIAEYGQNPNFNPLFDQIAVNISEGGIRILER